MQRTCNDKSKSGESNSKIIENDEQYDDYACYDMPVYSDVISCSGNRKPFQFRTKLKRGY